MFRLSVSRFFCFVSTATHLSCGDFLRGGHKKSDLVSDCVLQYGYRLPELAEEEVVYCSVYFRLVGDRLFTYP